MIPESIAYLKNIISKDIFQLLTDMNANIAKWSDWSHIPELVFGIVGILLALAIGLAGYKFIRPTVSLIMAYGGLMIGDQLFRVLDERWSFLPDWLSWVPAILVAVLFATLAFKRASYVWAILGGVGSYCMLLFYIDDKVLAIGAAFLAALAISYLVRTSFVLVTGVAAGLLAVNFLSVIFPKVTAFDLQIDRPLSLIIAGSVALVFILTQFATNRFRGERLC